MNGENNFIKPIQKKTSSSLPAVGSHQPPAGSPSEYDPIKRLNNELAQLNQNYQQVVQVLAGLIQRQDKVEQRPMAATFEQVQELASKRPRINLNAEDFANHVKPALLARLPSPEQLAATAQRGADLITAAGSTTAEQIRQAGADSASRIEQATVASQNAVLGRLGFSSWRQATLLCFLPLLLAGAGLSAWSVEYVKRTELEKQLRNWTDFGAWIQEKYPLVWKKYNP